MARQAHHPPMPAGLFDAAPTEAVGYINSLDGVIGFGRDDFHVKVIPRNTAIRVILAHHYSGRIVANSYIHLGAFLDGEMLGVLQFGYAMNAASVGKIVANTGPTEHLELNRMWFDDAAPRNSESRALSYAAGGWAWSIRPRISSTLAATKQRSTSLTGKPTTGCC